MLWLQKTVAAQASISGVGLHTGEQTRLTLTPAPVNTGLVFRLTSDGRQVEIPAVVENVCVEADNRRRTTLERDGVSVTTVEHILSALHGSGVTNCYIELEGSEPPVVGVGSAPNRRGWSGHSVGGYLATAAAVTEAAREAGIEVSLFIDPDPAVVEASAGLGATTVELHTGDYCEARRGRATAELERLREAAAAAAAAGLTVAAGHGLDYPNVQAVARLPQVEELNIGHAIISRAVFSGLERAVRDMLALINS